MIGYVIMHCLLSVVYNEPMSCAVSVIVDKALWIHCIFLLFDTINFLIFLFL